MSRNPGGGPLEVVDFEIRRRALNAGVENCDGLYSVSVRRADNFNTDNNPISVVERLNSLPHPLRNAVKGHHPLGFKTGQGLFQGLLQMPQGWAKNLAKSTPRFIFW